MSGKLPENRMKIKAILPYFGGKRNLAPRIVEMLGDHRVYWEPFCGSMAVLMAKPPCVMETVNDLHKDLINLARVIQDVKLANRLYRKMRRTLMHEQLFREAAERYKQRGYYKNLDSPDFDRAYEYLLLSWLGRNGVTGTHSYNQGFCVRYTANGGHAAKRFQSVIDSIYAWRRRLANVTILDRDAFELLERIDDKKGTVIYIDPPYIKKGAKYIHDFKETDHWRLAELLNKFDKARIVVSYYDHPKLYELYPDWQRVEINISKSLVNQGMRYKKTKIIANEVLLVNKKIQSKGLF
jgi:DNA adenine methylase